MVVVAGVPHYLFVLLVPGYTFSSRFANPGIYAEIPGSGEGDDAPVNPGYFASLIMTYRQHTGHGQSRHRPADEELRLAHIFDLACNVHVEPRRHDRQYRTAGDY